MITRRRARILGALAAVVVVAVWVLISALRPAPCSGAVFFEFRPPLGEPGRYRVSVKLDEGTRRCELELTLPLEKAPDKSGCPMALELKTQGHENASQLVGLALGDSPKRIALTVHQGNELLYQSELTPSYSPYSVERELGQKFCGKRAFVKPDCIRGSKQCWPFATNCDGPEDCKKEQICCVDPEWGASYGPSTATECTTPSRCLARVAELACHRDGDCSKGTRCRRAPYANDFQGELSVCR